MNPTKPLLISIASVCIALLGIALYLQLVEKMLPCPLCVMQRYAFVMVALFCLLALALPDVGRRLSSAMALTASAFGLGVAAYHVWILANPQLTCGIDPLETSLNKIFPAKLLPTMFRADGICETPYEPILGLSIPAWSAVWFGIFSIALLVILIQNRKAQRRHLFRSLR